MKKKNWVKVGLFIFYVFSMLYGVLTFYTTQSFIYCLIIATFIVITSYILTIITIDAI